MIIDQEKIDKGGWQNDNVVNGSFYMYGSRHSGPRAIHPRGDEEYRFRGPDGWGYTISIFDNGSIHVKKACFL